MSFKRLARLSAVAITVFLYFSLIMSLSRVANFVGWHPLWWHLGMITAWTLLAVAMSVIFLFAGQQTHKVKTA